jgi:hypothetical protein
MLHPVKHRFSSKALRRRTFRPALEILEDRSLPSNLSPLLFDPSTGLLDIRADSQNAIVAERILPSGFVEVRLDGQRHDSDPGSAFFDAALAGASQTSVSGIRLEGGGGQAELLLGSQTLAGDLTVSAEGPVLVQGGVAAGGALAITAPTITIRGALEGGEVALTSPGTIRVQAGAAVEASGGGTVAIAGGEIVNRGQIDADGATGGQVWISADRVMNAGRITADGLDGSGGTVWVGHTGSDNGAASGVVVDAGVLQATGSQGGSVTVTGAAITLTPTAAVDVSGNNGGGSVRIGGDFHGQGSTPTAQQTFIAAGATINADALAQGAGGSVVIWSNEQTWYYGSIFARGGAELGDGGNLEVSGKQNLVYNGPADTSAVKGRDGTLLLDPYDINIVVDGDTSDWRDAQFFNQPNLHGDPSYLNPGGTDVSVASINSAVFAGVTLSAYHDVNVNTPVSIAHIGTSLGLYAGHDINLNNPITVNAANINLNADDNHTGNGGIISQALGANLTIANSQPGNGIDLSADQYDLNAPFNTGANGSVYFQRSIAEPIKLASSITHDGTNTIYVSLDEMNHITARVLYAGADLYAGDITLLSDLDISGSSGPGQYDFLLSTTGNITAFDGAVYHSFSFGSHEVTWSPSGDIITGNITGAGIFWHSQGAIRIHGDVNLLGDLILESQAYFATGAINLGSGSFVFVPIVPGLLVTIGGAGGTGSLEFTDAELANISASSVVIGDVYQDSTIVLGNNIDLTGRWDLAFLSTSGSYDDMGYTVTQGDHVFYVFGPP